MVAAGVVVASMFSAGWTARGWLEDSKELAAQKAAEFVIDREREREADIAAKVSTLLQNSVVKERVIQKELQPIIERPIYQVDCIDDDGLRVINGLSATTDN